MTKKTVCNYEKRLFKLKSTRKVKKYEEYISFMLV